MFLPRQYKHPNVLLLEELRLCDLQGRDRSRDIILIPLAPVENHGTHLPAGTDIYVSEEMAVRVAERYAARHPDAGLLIYPTISIGSAAIRGIGSTKTTSRLLRKSLDVLAGRYRKQGFRRFVFFSGHGGVPHVAALDAACRKLSRRGATAVAPLSKIAMKAYAGDYTEAVNAAGRGRWKITAEDFLNDLHGGFMETSMMLAIRPDLVGKEYRDAPAIRAKDRWWLRAFREGLEKLLRRLPMKEETRKSLSLALRVGAINLSWIIAGRKAGYHGSPALADAEIGEILLNASADGSVGIMEDVFERGVRPEHYRNVASAWDALRAVGYAAVLAGALAVTYKIFWR